MRTCAFCDQPSAVLCGKLMPDAFRKVRTDEIRHGDTLVIDRTSKRALLGKVVDIEVLPGSGSWFKVTAEMDSGARVSATRFAPSFLTVSGPGPCAKPACELHHADRGAPGAEVCADHWRLPDAA